MTQSEVLDDWPPAGCPPLAWPLEPVSRREWYGAVLGAYAQLWDQTPGAPVDAAALDALEQRLACPLPPALREYHREFGALSLAERLCSVAGSDICIEPLLDAFPGIVDLAGTGAELELAEKLVAFGDYLGNGNLFCFHRETGEVYYFDHDGGALLTRFFASPEDYLDALMILCLAEIHDDDEGGEALLSERFGRELVHKWRY